MSSEWFALSEQEFLNRYTYVPHENKLYRSMMQPTEDMIYAENAELRKQQQKGLGFGRYVGQIPNIVLEEWRRKHPELRCWDKEIRTKKLMQLMRENPRVLVVEKSKL